MKSRALRLVAASILVLAGLASAALAATFRDYSGSVAAASTWQILMPANQSRKFFFFENTSAAVELVNSCLAAPLTIHGSTGGAISVPAGGNFRMDAGFVSTDAWCVYSITQGSAFVAKEGSQ